jgi:hypothetical protein
MPTASRRPKPLGLFQGKPTPRFCDHLIGFHLIGFQRGEITVREGKGDTDRGTVLPKAVVRPLQEHLRRVQAIHQQHLAGGYGRVEPPHVLARRYPDANREWCWQFLFPQEHRCVNARTGEQGRHHVHESLVQKAVSDRSV